MRYASLSESENDFLRHMMMWGSNGYPIQKVSGGKWIWAPCWGIKGAPTVYKRKRDAAKAIENYVDVLRDRAAGRL